MIFFSGSSTISNLDEYQDEDRNHDLTSPILLEDDSVEDKNTNDTTSSLLELEKIFDNYDLAEHFLNQYARSNGFVIIKGQIEKDKNNKSRIVRRTFECHHGRSRKSKKVIDLMQQRDRQSEKINCPW